MIVDSSAIVSVLRNEPDAGDFKHVIARADVRRLSAASFLEVSIVLGRDAQIAMEFDRFLLSSAIGIEPVTEAQARIARQAYRDFGRGSGHSARLNFGDCLAYALAKDKDEPLLFKGTDFGQTDIKSAV